MHDTILIRNERRKLLANCLNSAAAAVFVGGWLPPLVLVTLGVARPGPGVVLLAGFASALGALIFSFAWRVLAGLETADV